MQGFVGKRAGLILGVIAASSGCALEPDVILGTLSEKDPGGSSASSGGGDSGEGAGGSAGFGAHAGAAASVGFGANAGLGGAHTGPVGGYGGSAPWPPPSRPCHEEGLYFESQTGDGPTHYVPVECHDPPESIRYMCEAVQADTRSRECHDVGFGLSSDGELRIPRDESDMPVLSMSNAAPGSLGTGSVCVEFMWWQCHVGGQVLGTYDCGDVPTGEGGSIEPGTYTLTAMVEFANPGFRIAANNFSQTLFVSATSVLLVSDDSANFSFTGSYTYATEGNEIAFTPRCESQGEQYRPWALVGTFSATSTQLDFYSVERGFWASYQRVQ
jgi:hypothetical protein